VQLHDLLGGLDVLGTRAWADVDVGTVVSDSRQASPGALFACIPGALTDGHEYARDAVESGAVALLVERLLDVDVPQAQVRSVRQVVGVVAARSNGEPSQHLRVLGVTGTNGKTTTSYLLDAIARAAGVRSGLIGTVETRIGGKSSAPEHTTPEATELQSLLARMRAAGVEIVSMEVSSHALDQYRVDGTHYAAVCFTNLSHDHLDYHKTLDAYFEAKARLFTTTFTTRAAINVDDEHGALLAERARNAGLHVLTYSAGHGELHATNVDLARDRTRMQLCWPDGTTTSITTQLVGRFNVENAVAAAATARLAGFEADVIAAGLGAPVAVPGRMERIEAGQPFLVLVDYAHTPDALDRLLNASRSLTAPGGRVVVVYGCGGDRDRAKRPIMGSVAARGADLAFLTSDNPRSEAPNAIIDDVLRGAGGTTPTVEPDRRNAIRQALATAHPGDVVVIAGKGHETGQTANGVTVPFDDRLVAREELEALACT
jgi:UDP-N-acetylmuramoyl-L-alanyl-D-glutamate--2,6-diaminopimelate ligase